MHIYNFGDMKWHKTQDCSCPFSYAQLQLACLIGFASLFFFSMALSILTALPTSVMAPPAYVKITARSLKPAKLIFLFPFAHLICAMTELRPQSGFRAKTTCAPFEIPESKGRYGESCLNTLQ